MIFLDNAPAPQDPHRQNPRSQDPICHDPGSQPDLSSRHLLAACMTEAAYLARTIALLDRDLARACKDLSPEALRCLQAIDLLSQEVAGLARLMQLILPEEIAERRIGPDEIRSAAPLQKQRIRLQSGG